MTVYVIELLEKIDVTNDDAQRAFGTDAAFPFGGQGFIEIASIGNIGQRPRKSWKPTMPALPATT